MDKEMTVLRRTIKQPKGKQAGSILVTILVLMIFFTFMLIGLTTLANSNVIRSKSRVLLLQAQYAAESGADSAIAQLNNVSDTYSGTTGDVLLLSTPNYKATYAVTVVSGSTIKERVITATGKVYSPATAAQPQYTRRIKVVAQRSTTTVSAGAVSRNVIYIESGVKNLTARDVYANGFIQLNKNTTNLVAENITVGGKNTGATNCSIGGAGNLVKPSTFHTAGQTTTNITMAYNNCITPPGNTSNASFTVQANQSTIPSINSTYIPTSYSMDSTYTAAGSCNDLTTGTFPRNLPSTAGSKKTHYPDSASGVSNACGVSGDLGDIVLDSGQYNITDNVHIRASLCAKTACDITLNNPSATLRWIFVEGSVNFNSVQTVPGSGPLVLVVYGTDPGSLAAVCPYGGSFYLGNNGTTTASALYVLAMNGVCLDKTKFGSSPALGGLSGKNLYIASNPGTPFDLALDPAFPANQIPVDLAWRAVYYVRL